MIERDVTLLYQFENVVLMKLYMGTLSCRPSLIKVEFLINILFLENLFLNYHSFKNNSNFMAVVIIKKKKKNHYVDV